MMRRAGLGLRRALFLGWRVPGVGQKGRCGVDRNGSGILGDVVA